MPKTYVYIYLEKAPVLAGILEIDYASQGTVTHFHYGRRYLQRKDRIAIDPVQLPLHDPDVEIDYIAPEGFILFNGIRDAAPDGWGRYIINRIAHARELTEFDYLVATGDDRSGALAFGPDQSGPKRTLYWPEKKLSHEHFSLTELLKAVKELDSSDVISNKHLPFLLAGSSLGGARPKATTVLEDKQWIAKFSRHDDHYPICRMEYATMSLAANAGLTIPTIRLEKILGQDIYLIERFDRIPLNSDYKRIPFISGLTMTGAHESEASQQSYRSLAEQLRLYGSHFQKDAIELWRRMIFNILCNNTDDHLRNHGFLWDGSGWRLSPAYDITPTLQMGTDRYLALGVGEKGRQASLKNALSDAASFGLSQQEATHIILTMQKKVKTNWQNYFKKSGISSANIEKMRSCFIACDELLDE